MAGKEKKYGNLKKVGKMTLPFPLRMLYWFKLKKNIDKEKENIKTNSERIISSTYKKFDYYCPHCLYQTNEFKKICPECRRGRILKTKQED
jgi:lipopolysaccharide biosynthesis regulator YciM